MVWEDERASTLLYTNGKSLLEKGAWLQRAKGVKGREGGNYCEG